MKCVKIKPSLLSGEIEIPPSKSMSHRAIICAALAEGESFIENVILSQDILATIQAMKALGAEIKVYRRYEGSEKINTHFINDFYKENCAIIEDQFDDSEIHCLLVVGNPYPTLKSSVIDCRESGSTIRFLIPIALLTGKEVEFVGKGKLVERPLDTYYEIFKKQHISYSNCQGKLPLRVKGNLKSGEYRVKGNISSQFITGLLLALPLLLGDSNIIITTELESKGYIDLTLDMLKKFSVEIENRDYKEFYIKGNQKYINKNYKVEGDFSQGAFYLVGGALGNSILCKDLDMESLQGDKVILDVIKAMGGHLQGFNMEVDETINNGIKVQCANTEGIVIDASQCPDLVPIMAVLASLSHGTTKIINAGRLRIKESDRLKAISEELNKLGASIQELQDGLIIQGKPFLKGGKVNSWNDHRIAMALAIGATRCKEEVIIENSEVVKKSYPSFWRDYARLGGEIYEYDTRE